MNDLNRCTLEMFEITGMCIAACLVLLVIISLVWMILERGI